MTLTELLLALGLSELPHDTRSICWDEKNEYQEPRALAMQSEATISIKIPEFNSHCRK